MPTVDATDSIWFGDTLVHVRTAHAGSADGISCLDSTAPRGDSPPLHVHHTEDELFHVLEGRLRLRAGETDVWLDEGETFLAPKGVPHTYLVESQTARWLLVTTNGDFEAFVRAAGRPADAAGLPEPAGPPSAAQAEALAELSARHGIELIGPPLGQP